MNTTKDKKLYVTESGAEEWIERQVTFTMTMTPNGKFALHIEDTEASGRPATIIDDREDAKKKFGESMALIGHMISDPKKTIKIILKGLSER